MPRVLSLDISAASTGFAFVSDKDKSQIEVGLITTSPKMSRPERLVLYRKELKKLFKKFNPTHVVMEDVFGGLNTKVLVLLAKFGGVTEECCLSELGVEPYIIHTNTVKAYFKTKTKEDLFNFIVDILEWKDTKFKKDNDKSDAAAQLMCYCDHVLGKIKYRIEKDDVYEYMDITPKTK